MRQDETRYMNNETVRVKLIDAANRGDRNEAPRFSERYAMREAAQRLAALEAENARMRAVVEAVADETGYVRRQCFLCDARTVGWGNSMAHTADCPVTKARAILASASDTAALPVIQRETTLGTPVTSSRMLDSMTVADPAVVKDGGIPVYRGEMPPCAHGRDSYTVRIATVVRDDKPFHLMACAVCGHLWEMPNDTTNETEGKK